MNYQKHYNQLMERARDRQLNGYCERHHVIPKCLGGGNSKDNVVRLTPEEHYVAHLLLVKIHPANHRLLWAAVAMTNQTTRMARRNKLYGWLRRRFVETVSERSRGWKHTAESKAKMSAVRAGRKRGPHSEATKLKMSMAAKGKPKSPEHRLAMSRERQGKKRNPHTDETREKIRQSNILAKSLADKTWMRSPEYRLKQSERSKEMWRKRKAEPEV